YKTSHINFLNQRIAELPQEIKSLETEISKSKAAEVQKLQNTLANKRQQLDSYRNEVQKYSTEKFNTLPQNQQSLHLRAFQTNEKDPHYHQVEEVIMEENGQKYPITV